MGIPPLIALGGLKIACGLTRKQIRHKFKPLLRFPGKKSAHFTTKKQIFYISSVTFPRGYMTTMQIHLYIRTNVLSREILKQMQIGDFKSRRLQ